MNPPLRVEAYVTSLHDGVFAQEGPAGRGLIHRIGPAAVLQIGSIDVLVCRHIAGNGDPQLYRAFGIKPVFYRLVVVKACTSHKDAYRPIADRLCETDTSGAARQHLATLPFKRVPRTIYPFTKEDRFDERAVTFGRGQGQV